MGAAEAAGSRRYPDLRIDAVCRRLPTHSGSGRRRLPADSGATVPDFHRLPVRDATVSLPRRRDAFLFSHVRAALFQGSTLRSQ